ncbi:MAG: D-alanine--D-alanine ligase [Candidatus Omnitrophota bacterium]|jgi:D-alanine-D-alanine ligase
MHAHWQVGRIGVLMGGPSAERAISLKSGSAVFACLKELALDVVSVDVQTDNVEENKRLLVAAGIDCAFVALHGKFGEDGGIQSLLEEMGIMYTGSDAAASRLAMDKVASRQSFEKAGLRVPRHLLFNKAAQAAEQADSLKNGRFPVVVKPAAQGSSIGLSIVDQPDGLLKALEDAFRFDDRVLVEEYIAGREVTVGILDDYPLPVIEIIPKKRFFDFEAKYHKGLTDYAVPARIEAPLAKICQDAAVAAHTSLGCFGCSRVDLIIADDCRPYVLEVNTIPGMTETSLLPMAAGAVGIDFSLLCLRLLGVAIRRRSPARAV